MSAHNLWNSLSCDNIPSSAKLKCSEEAKETTQEFIQTFKYKTNWKNILVTLLPNSFFTNMWLPKCFESS